MEALLTVKQMAEILSVSTRTARRILERRELPFIQNPLRVCRTDLDSWLASGKVEMSLARRLLRQSGTLALNPLGGGLNLASTTAKGRLVFGSVYKRTNCKHWTIDYLDYRIIQDNGKPKRVQEVVKRAVTKQDALNALRAKEKEVIGTDEIEGESISFKEY